MILVAHNIRSALNTGSMMRSAACFGVEEFVIGGYTPYPKIKNDERLPHEIAKTEKNLTKTALGAQNSLKISKPKSLEQYLKSKRQSGYQIVALEQDEGSLNLADYQPAGQTVLIVGNEVDGVEDWILKLVDDIVEIPMPGKKESLNVAVATGIAIYEFTKL